MSSDTSDTSNADDTAQSNDGVEPDTADLQEPSTEKAPGEEPTSTDPEATEGDAGDGDEPSHQAVGIGVIGGALVDPENVDGAQEG